MDPYNKLPAVMQRAREALRVGVMAPGMEARVPVGDLALLLAKLELWGSQPEG